MSRGRVCIMSSSDEEAEDNELEQLRSDLLSAKSMLRKCERKLKDLKDIHARERNSTQVTQTEKPSRPSEGLWAVKKVLATRDEHVLVEWEPTWIRSSELCIP